MEQADGIGAVAQPQGESGHVELLRVAIDAETETEHRLDRDLGALEEGAGDAPDEVGVEALVAGGNRRVDGKDRVAPDLDPCVVELRAARDELAGALGEQERRVALVEVPHSGLEVQRPDRADATDPENQLLVEPHLAAANVEHVATSTLRSRVRDEAC